MALHDPDNVVAMRLQSDLNAGRQHADDPEVAMRLAATIAAKKAEVRAGRRSRSPSPSRTPKSMSGLLRPDGEFGDAAGDAVRGVAAERKTKAFHKMAKALVRRRKQEARRWARALHLKDGTRNEPDASCA